jgi:hypothetical protein
LLEIDKLEPAESPGEAIPDLDSIFAEISRDRLSAARKVLAFVKRNPDARGFINMARRLVFLKGSNSHDYKFSSAVLEDFQHIASPLRDQFLAASVFNLRGSGEADNSLVQRTRHAFL